MTHIEISLLPDFLKGHERISLKGERVVPSHLSIWSLAAQRSEFLPLETGKGFLLVMKTLVYFETETTQLNNRCQMRRQL